MGTDRTRRGFFGWLAGLVALPALAWRYPPVKAYLWYDMPHDGPDREAEVRFYDALHDARVGDVYKFRRMRGKPPEGGDGHDGYMVVIEMVDSGDARTWPRFVDIDHRPKWAEVRTVLAKHRGAA